MARDRSSLIVPLVATLAIHGLFAAGLHAAERYVHRPGPPPAMEVSFDIKKEPPPPPPPPPEIEKPPPPPPPEAAKPVKKVASSKPPPTPRVVPPEAPPPAPGPPDETPAPQKIYTMDTGTIYVNPGDPNGSSAGQPGGKGKGKGGGAAPGTDGTGGPRPVALASVKVMPEAIGDYDYNKDYPDEARKLGVEGDVSVRMLIDVEGKVAETKLAKGLGHGLDGKALELARRIRFKPARDEADQPVATWITWKFSFTLPR